MDEIIIGVDIGGTSTKFGLVDPFGHILAEGTMPTDVYHDVDLFLEYLKKEIDVLLARKEYRVKAMGIGAPNGNFYTGTIEFAPNLPWKGVIPLAAKAEKLFGVPVKLTNDANAAAQGEMIYGNARGMKNFIMITLGTGVGSGIVVNGAMVYGHDGFAGELGHTIVDPEGRMCGCGRKGCLETYASAGGIKRTVFELLAQEHIKSALRAKSYYDLTAKDISIAARNGDPIALKAFDMTGKLLALKMSDAVAHTSPEAFILFGGLSGAGDFLMDPLKKYFEEFLLPVYRNKIKILFSGLQDKNIAVLGAAALAFSE